MGDRLAPVGCGKSKKNLNKKELVNRVEMKIRSTVFPKKKFNFREKNLRYNNFLGKK
jgi:hypothetical protein